MLDTTSFTVILRQRTTIDNLRGLLESLEESGAVEGAEVRLLTVGPGVPPVRVPAGTRIPGGDELPAIVLTEQTLPPQGIVIQGELGSE